MVFSLLFVFILSYLYINQSQAYILHGKRFKSYATSLQMGTSSSTSPILASAVSSNTDLQLAIDEIIAKITHKHQGKEFSTAIFFASTAYEAAGFQYDIITDTLRSKLSHLTSIVGCTSGGVIGTTDPTISNEPVEIENRASLSVLLLDAATPHQLSRYSQEQVEDIAAQTIPPPQTTSTPSSGMTILLSTEATKPHLSNFLASLAAKPGHSYVFGGFASSVNSYQKPKVFAHITSDATKVERHVDGIVGLTLLGDYHLQYLIARSCVPVGPMFEVTSTGTKYEITGLKRFDASAPTASESLPPLVQLEQVLNEINANEKYGLTRELILSSVQRAPSAIHAEALPSIVAEEDFFSQKPTSFDPYTGSITLSSLPHVGGTFQFCVRDNAAARRGVTAAQLQLSQLLDTTSPLAAFLIGSLERGNKVFKYQSWEALQLFHTLQDQRRDAPIFGLFSNGAFARLPLTATQDFSAIMETDSVYAVLLAGKGPSTTSSVRGLDLAEDVMTPFELKHFSDESATVMVDKSLVESANTIRVAGMDYLVPDKMPQARYVLEHFVWERLKDADRQRERFPMARALTQAKVAEGKFPRRDLVAAISAHSKTAKLLPVIVELHRTSLHNGRLLYDPSNMADQMLRLTKAATQSGVVALGVQTDVSFTGLYEDLEVVKKHSQVPLINNDFVVFGYQLFRAKASGADAVKLLASVLSAQELTYLIKTAKAIGLSTIVVVASKAQLLDVLANVAGVSMISVTSRNHFLWKIDALKANRILADTEVSSAVAVWKAKDTSHLLFLEGFSGRAELETARSSGVDALILGEEVLLGCSEGSEEDYGESLRKWIC